MKLLPLFPLQIALLPGQETMLHIFEPRYKQLFADVIENDIPFGIPFITNGKVKTYGTLCMLSRVANKYQSGELDVIIKAIEIFEIVDFFEQHPVKLYPTGNVVLTEATRFMPSSKLLSEFNSFAFRFLKEFDATGSKLTSFDIAAQMQLSEEQKYEIIGFNNQTTLNRFLLNNLRINGALLSQELKLQGNYYLN